MIRIDLVTPEKQSPASMGFVKDTLMIEDVSMIIHGIPSTVPPIFALVPFDCLSQHLKHSWTYVSSVCLWLISHSVLLITRRMNEFGKVQIPTSLLCQVEVHKLLPIVL